MVEGFEEPSQVGGVYQISAAGELYWFTARVNGLLTDGTHPNRAANAVLTNDITVNSMYWTKVATLLKHQRHTSIGFLSAIRIDHIPAHLMDKDIPSVDCTLTIVQRIT